MSREEKIKEIFSQRMKGFAASMEEQEHIQTHIITRCIFIQKVLLMWIQDHKKEKI